MDIYILVVYVCVYIYIYRERDGERETKKESCHTIISVANISLLARIIVSYQAYLTLLCC